MTRKNLPFLFPINLTLYHDIQKTKDAFLAQDLKTVVRDYYAALDYAFMTKDLERVQHCLADDCKLVGINEYFEGKESVLRLFSKSIVLIQRMDLQRQYFDYDSCCTITKVITSIPGIHVDNIEWIVIRDGQITEINIIYDAQAWQRYMRLTQFSTNIHSPY